MNDAPFSITFGKQPKNYIDRFEERTSIINDFLRDVPQSNSYLLIGSRGSGKTVLMSAISNCLKQKDDWVVVDPGSKENMLPRIAASIYEKGKIKHYFLESEWSFSFHGFGISISGKNPVTDVKNLLENMLGHLKKKKKKVLITIDEVDNSKEMKQFLADYQQLIREDYDIRLLMTGLYENVWRLINHKSLTFLYRCPSFSLGPLSIPLICSSYMELLGVDENIALSLAKLSKGFAFAYQLLGVLYSKNKETGISPLLLAEYDECLAKYVYDKAFADMSEWERKIVFSIGGSNAVPVKDVCEKAGLSIKSFGVYRSRLIKKGILVSPNNGFIAFALPRFDKYLAYLDEDLLV